MLAVSNYHYIRENFDSKYPSIFGLTPKQFEKQLIELSKYGNFISQSELLEFKNKPFDKNYILITFDDGLKEQFELAKPILNRMGIPFICFINSENFIDKKVSLVHKIHMIRSKISPEEIINIIGNKYNLKLNNDEKNKAKINYSYDDEKSAYLKYLLNFKLCFEEQNNSMNPIFNTLWNEEEAVKSLYMTDEQLQILCDDDCLGSHSHSHIPLGVFERDIISEEFKKTQSFFKKIFGKKAQSISYPYGSFEACDKVSNLASKYHFELGFSMERAASKSIDNNPLMISRFDCNDMPMGKSSLFKDNLFSNINTSNWYQK